MQLVSNYQINGANPVTVGGTGTTAKYFPAPSGQIGIAGVVPSATSAAGQLPVPGSNRLNAQPFRIYASGNFEVGAGGACPNTLIEVVANTGTITSPIYTTIASSGQVTTQALTGTFYDWSFQIDCNGSTQSGLLQGRYSCVVDGVTQNSSPAALTNTLSGLVFGPSGASFPTNSVNTSEPVFGLVVRVTFSVSEAGNKANMYAFYIES